MIVGRIPKTTTATRIYTFGTTILYLTATIVLAASARHSANVSTPGIGDIISKDAWALTAAIVTISLSISLLTRRYVVFRISAILTAMWASAYEVNLLIALYRSQTVTVGVILWGWVVMVHILFTRYRLTPWSMWILPPITPADLPESEATKATQLQQLTDSELPPKPRLRSTQSDREAPDNVDSR